MEKRMASNRVQHRRRFGYLHQLQSRRWQASYLDPRRGDRVVAEETFRTKRDAEQWLVDVEARLRRGDLPDVRLSRFTFGQWAHQWLATVQVRPATKEKYASIVNNHLMPVFGPTPVNAITRSDVAAFVAAMAGRGAGDGTVANARRVLSMVLGEAVQSDALRRNPAQGVRVRRSRRQEMLFLSRDEVLSLADAITHPPVRPGGGEHRRPTYPEYGLLVRLAAETGLRAGEIAALRAGRVDVITGRIEVAESAAEVPRRICPGGLLYEEPKTYERRSVPLHRALADELADHLMTRPLDAGALVVTAPDGGPLRHTNFYRRHFKPAVITAGLPAATRFHDLRHTCAALLIAEGAHALAVKQRLGHSSITVTFDRYGNLFPSVEEALTDRMEASYRSEVTLKHLLWPPFARLLIARGSRDGPWRRGCG
ncbi:MAG TPA: site-specific integrase [Acidimicrobiales bacterium]|nr:site-specific integrase [Acidimicrobiales bacterium]